MNWMSLLAALVAQAGPNLFKVLPDLKVIAEALGRILVIIKGTPVAPTVAMSSRPDAQAFLQRAQEAGISQEDAHQILHSFAAASDHLPAGTV